MIYKLGLVVRNIFQGIYYYQVPVNILSN